MNLHFNEATIAKMILKQARHQIDHLEILVALGKPAQNIHATLGHWFDDMRLHLQRLEAMTEETQSVH